MFGVFDVCESAGEAGQFTSRLLPVDFLRVRMIKGVLRTRKMDGLKREKAVVWHA